MSNNVKIYVCENTLWVFMYRETARLETLLRATHYNTENHVEYFCLTINFFPSKISNTLSFISETLLHSIVELMRFDVLNISIKF